MPPMEESPAASPAGKLRNPNWSRDETILLLDLYQNAPTAHATHPAVVALSRDLNRAARRAGAQPLPTFRNPAGIAMRLRNLGRLDPAADNRDQGLRPGGAMDREVWGELASDEERLAREVARIRAAIDSPQTDQSPAPANESLRPVLDRILSGEARDALLLLVDKARQAGLKIVYRSSEVKAVEFQDGSRRNLFSVIGNQRHLLFYLRKPALNRATTLWPAAVRRFGAQKANKRGEYRIRIHNAEQARDTLAWLQETGAWSDIIERVGGAGLIARERELAPETFDAVTAEHFLQAARMLARGFSDHPFHESTDYDVLFDGHRLSPKALLGVAAKLALGRQLSPSDFRGGRETVCFRLIAAAGYTILSKKEKAAREPSLSAEERRWTEGNVRLVTHLRRERGAGLASAKRASFRAARGKLCCERCGLDPIEYFGDLDGEACIEVHHRKETIANMAPGHQTELEDLECLCANCHRFVHRQMKSGPAASNRSTRDASPLHARLPGPLTPDIQGPDRSKDVTNESV